MRRLLPDPAAPDPAAPATPVDLLAAYAVPAEYDRHVRANMVTSADGAASAGGRSGGLSGPADRRVLGALRDLADVVLVGASTMRVERYGPARPDPDRQRRRRAAGLAAIPPIAVVSRHLDLDLTSAFFAAAVTRPVVLTVAAAPASRRAAIAAVADVVVVGDTELDAPVALDALAERGLRRVLCEGGPALLGGLVRAGVVDELCLTVAPRLLAGAAPRLVTGPALPAPAQLHLTSLLEQDGFLFMRYAVGGG